MKNKYLKFLLLALAVCSVSSVHAADFKLTGDASDASAFGDTVDAMDQIIALVYYVLYAVGAIMMGISGFKLKGGDIPGFVKMFLGGAMLFVSPLVVESLKGLGGN
jgi:hypothetical protein